jgi:hypothetical protein
MHFWPDRKGFAAQCYPDPRIMRDTGEILSRTGSIVALGYDGNWLRCDVRDQRGITVVHADGGEARVTDTVTDCTAILAARARPDGFLVAYIDRGNRRGPSAEYAIGFDGGVHRVGPYADLEPGDTPRTGTAALDGDGVLYQIVTHGHEAVVVRRPFATDATSIVFHAGQHPVSATDGMLVTGQ